MWLLLMHPQLGTWSTTQACALTGIQTSDSLVHRLALNPLSHTGQGNSISNIITMYACVGVCKAIGQNVNSVYLSLGLEVQGPFSP